VWALTQRIAELVVSELKFVECGVWLILPEDNLLRRAAYAGYAPDFVTFDIPLTRTGLMATAIQTGETLYAPDVRLDPRYLAGVHRSNSWCPCRPASGFWACSMLPGAGRLHRTSCRLQSPLPTCGAEMDNAQLVTSSNRL
jgi:hypothetical protein